jgi:carboxypeptidase family protein
MAGNPMARLPFVVILAVVPLWLPACFPFVVGDGLIRAEGTVTDSMGRPISNALVYIDTPSHNDYPASFERRTNSDGRFRLSAAVAPGRYSMRLVVRASGYRDATLAIPTLTPNTLAVTLERNENNNPSRIEVVRAK